MAHASRNSKRRSIRTDHFLRDTKTKNNVMPMKMAKPAAGHRASALTSSRHTGARQDERIVQNCATAVISISQSQQHFQKYTRKRHPSRDAAAAGE